ncbi:MAG: GspH/FimT family pseudopilin [Gemmatimonadales bacterium]|nr:GspH/FimT family pseudopilin [Gemmatimonadales bacterium]
MRHGFTLPEILMVLAILGLVMGIATPRMVALRDSLAVEQEAHRVVAAHRRARITSVVRGRPAVLTVGPDSMGIRVAGDPADTWGAQGPAASGVALAGPIRRMTFSPVGFTTGLSNASFNLSRGSARRTVVVSRLGRLRMTYP